MFFFFIYINNKGVFKFYPFEIYIKKKASQESPLCERTKFPVTKRIFLNKNLKI